MVESKPSQLAVDFFSNNAGSNFVELEIDNDFDGDNDCDEDQTDKEMNKMFGNPVTKPPSKKFKEDDDDFDFFSGTGKSDKTKKLKLVSKSKLNSKKLQANSDIKIKRDTHA